MALKAPSGNHERKTVLVFNPETEKKTPNQGLDPALKKRVAAYARVSTEQDAQQSSYEAQIEYYTGFIQNNPDWVFVGVYADEGISGTSYKKRDGFNKMVEDAKAGKIDLILTKSISRFARNTVDALSVTRELKSYNVEVRFEKENISSMDAQAELIFTIMSSIAQEESRSISENVRWGKQRSCEAGKVSLAWSNFLGYEKGPDGLPHIVEKEAKIVREIYRLYLEGKTLNAIAAQLTEEGHPTPRRCKHWHPSVVRGILSNEKYKGDARLQKTYIEDFLTKKVRVNHGERKQWYIHDSHDAIISEETFDLVQKEIERRTTGNHGRYFDSPFKCKLICGDCGGFYGHKIWDSNKSYRKVVWSCADKYKHESTCKTYRITDEEVKVAFLEAVNRLPQNRQTYCDIFEQEFLPMIGKTDDLEVKQSNLRDALMDLYVELDDLVKSNARKAQDQTEYKQKFDALNAKIEKKKAAVNDIEQKILDAKTRKENVRIFLEALRNTPSNCEITEFDTSFWHAIVDTATITRDKTIIFHFRNGKEETVTIKPIRKKRVVAKKEITALPETPAKRKRGRPRKDTQLNVQVTPPDIPVKRKRGRPRKDEAKGKEDTPPEPPLKRKRGRPRKNAQMNEVVTIPVPPVKRKRGRPRKNAQ